MSKWQRLWINVSMRVQRQPRHRGAVWSAAPSPVRAVLATTSSLQSELEPSSCEPK